ncbi:MAG: hypothetical protein ACQ9MH_01610 [Nitrospinales bacterium]
MALRLKVSLKFLTISLLLTAITLSQSAQEVHAEEKNLRPYFEYQGNYGDQINEQKAKFKKQFGYDLVDLDKNWTPEEIAIMQSTFSQLPDSFYHLKGVKGFYRREFLSDSENGNDFGDIPAATWPKFRLVYRNTLKSHVVEIDNDPLRIEFYNSLFYEDSNIIINIIQHEMGHVFDISKKFLSLHNKWLEIANFKVIHYPPLDAKSGDDFLYKLNNDSKSTKYAPVSIRHMSTYSRENPQEDFANSVAAYIHYPYFGYSHPKRYSFLKNNVFMGKEYHKVDKSIESYLKKIRQDLNTAVLQNNWEEIVHIAMETSRSRLPKIEQEIIDTLINATNNDLSPGEYLKAVEASCYLYEPAALKYRRDLTIKRRVRVSDVLQIPRCFRMGTKVFEEKISKWPMTRIIFMRENDQNYIQFIDPALLTSYSRGYLTSYSWKISMTEEPGKILSRGAIKSNTPITGAVKIKLLDASRNDIGLPEGRKLILDLKAERIRPEPFKKLESSLARIQFVIYPWLNYQGPSSPSIKMLYTKNKNH